MKANTTEHMKFMKLKRRLNLPKWQVTGLLESIWQLTAKSAPRGDIGRYTNEEIAAHIEWDGDEHELIDELVKAGWLDECEDHRLVVHDWPDHAPNFIKGGISSRNEQFAVARSPKQQGLFKHAAESEKPEPDKADQAPRFKPEDADLPAPLDTPAFRAKWIEWHAYRREQRHAKWKAKTCAAALNRLSGLGEAAAMKAIDQSISNGWQGLFPEKGNGAPRLKPEPNARPEDTKVKYL